MKTVTSKDASKNVSKDASKNASKDESKDASKDEAKDASKDAAKAEDWLKRTNAALLASSFLYKK